MAKAVVPAAPSPGPPESTEASEAVTGRPLSTPDAARPDPGRPVLEKEELNRDRGVCLRGWDLGERAALEELEELEEPEPPDQMLLPAFCLAPVGDSASCPARRAIPDSQPSPNGATNRPRQTAQNGRKGDIAFLLEQTGSTERNSAALFGDARWLGLAMP